MWSPNLIIALWSQCNGFLGWYWSQAVRSSCWQCWAWGLLMWFGEQNCENEKLDKKQLWFWEGIGIMTLKVFLLVMRLGMCWLLRLFGAGGNISGHEVVFILGCSFQPWVLMVWKVDWLCGYDSEMQNSRGIVKTKECGLSFKWDTSNLHFPKKFPTSHWILKWLANTDQNFLSETHFGWGGKRWINSNKLVLLCHYRS